MRRGNSDLVTGSVLAFLWWGFVIWFLVFKAWPWLIAVLKANGVKGL